MRRDEPDVHRVEASPPLPAEPAVVIATLAPLVTPARLARIEAVVAGRTYRIALVLEELADPHNGSAVLRSADAFGVQRIHVIEGQHGFLASRGVSKGTHRWLDIVKHPSAVACVDAIRADGYRLFVAAMDGALGPDEVAREPGRIALVFGNEHRGASGPIREQAHGTFAVPMRGFVESLNVSVAAAITMEAVTRGRPGDLAAEERDRLIARYLLLSVRDGEQVVRKAAGDPR